MGFCQEQWAETVAVKGRGNFISAAGVFFGRKDIADSVRGQSGDAGMFDVRGAQGVFDSHPDFTDRLARKSNQLKIIDAQGVQGRGIGKEYL